MSLFSDLWNDMGSRLPINQVLWCFGTATFVWALYKMLDFCVDESVAKFRDWRWKREQKRSGTNLVRDFIEEMESH